MNNDLFMVVRMDDHGVNFLIKDDLDDQEASALMASMPDHHKQSYTVLEYSSDAKAVNAKAAMLFRHGVIV